MLQVVAVAPVAPADVDLIMPMMEKLVTAAQEQPTIY